MSQSMSAVGEPPAVALGPDQVDDVRHPGVVLGGLGGPGRLRSPPVNAPGSSSPSGRGPPSASSSRPGPAGLQQQLAAPAAGHQRRAVAGHHADRHEPVRARRVQGRHQPALGAQRQPEGGVLDVAAGDQRPVRRPARPRRRAAGSRGRRPARPPRWRRRAALTSRSSGRSEHGTSASRSRESRRLDLRVSIVQQGTSAHGFLLSPARAPLPFGHPLGGLKPVRGPSWSRAAAGSRLSAGQPGCH